MKKIILLDLNATFVANTSQAHDLPYTYNVEKERYRSWLKDMIKDEYVILMTSRPSRYRDATLRRIQQLENWQPNESYFNQWRKPAQVAKEIMMKRFIIPKHGQHMKDVKYIALESNFKTADMYRIEFGIYSRRQQDVKKDGRLEPKVTNSLFDDAENS